MFKVFLKGIIFGFGFITAFVIGAVVLQGYELVAPKKGVFDSSEAWSNSDYQSLAEWQNLSESEKIKAASAIIIFRYKDGEHGLRAAFVSEVHSKDGNTKIPYKVGERREKEDYYMKPNRFREREAMVMLMSGSPAKERGAYYVYEGRVSYKDMPLELFIKKFKSEQK